MMHRAMTVAVKQLASTTDISSSRYCNSTPPPATDPRPTQRKKLKALLNLLRHWAAIFRSGRLVLCTKINGRNLIQKLIHNVTIWISMIKLYQ